MTQVAIRDNIETLSVDGLAPYARNSRTHSPEQIAQIVASMREFGFTNPVLIDDAGGIIAGHGRVMAAAQLGLAKVPCLRLTGLTEAQKRAYVIADNKIALNAGWDENILAQEMRDLRAMDFDLTLAGFELDEITELMAGPPPAKDPDAAPPLPKTPTSAEGDVWILGQHRLVCGDSTSATNLQALMRGEMADACWTDPPYNVAYGDKAEYLNKGAANKQRNTDRILNDDMDDASFKQFLAGFYRAAWGVMKPGGAIYVAHSETERHNFTEQFLANGFKLSGCVIWKKNALVMGRSDYQWIHEPIIYGWKKGGAHKWYGGRKKTSVKQFGDGTPFVLIERMLVNSAKRGDIVFDPFGGSGSTLMACERLGMKARLSELSPGYVDVIVRRWQQFTGKRATLESTGQPFPE